MMYRLIVVGIFFLLSGCSSISYEEPLSGPRAKVRFTSSSHGATVVYGYEDSNCQGEQEWMRLRYGYLFNSSPKSLDIPLSENLHENQFKEFYLNSNRDYVFMFIGSSLGYQKTYSCGVPVKISIDEGKMYELAYDYSPKYCTATFYEIISKGSDDFEKIKVANFTNRPAGFGVECNKMFHKLRLY